MITVTLTAYNMGDVTIADFDSWTTYVSNHIDDRCGFSIKVEQGSFKGKGVLFEDKVDGATAEQEQTIREAIDTMYENMEW